MPKFTRLVQQRKYYNWFLLKLYEYDDTTILNKTYICSKRIPSAKHFLTIRNYLQRSIFLKLNIGKKCKNSAYLLGIIDLILWGTVACAICGNHGTVRHEFFWATLKIHTKHRTLPLGYRLTVSLIISHTTVTLLYYFSALLLLLCFVHLSPQQKNTKQNGFHQFY